MKKAAIFNVQRFSVHDGPGIRTTIFFKGCSLRCAWCHNPESYTPKRQIRFQSEKCIECQCCTAVCPQGIQLKNRGRPDTENCILCGSCEEACPSGAIEMVGKMVTVDELMKIIRKDRAYYDNSGGGVTLSGGEVMLQYEFAGELLKEIKKENIQTAVDTAADVPCEYFFGVLPYTDLVLLDLKIMNPTLHKKYTGVSNQHILKNAERLFESGVEVQVRVPLIKGVNDTVENAELLKSFLFGHPNVTEVKLLPYHSMGVAKAKTVGMHMELFEAPDKERIGQLKNVLKSWIKEE